MKKLFFLLLSLTAVSFSQAQEADKITHAFSLDQCVDFAQKNNVQVKNALLAVQVQAQTNREIAAAALPTITASTNLVDYTQIPTSLLPAQIFGGPAGTFIPVQFGTKYNATYGANMQQLLFDGQVFIGFAKKECGLNTGKYQSKYL
jgi:outer membrane protein TolC